MRTIIVESPDPGDTPSLAPEGRGDWSDAYGAEHQSKMTPFAPMLGYNNGLKELKGLVRSIVSNVVDVRDPIQVAYDRIANRAAAMLV
jgi:hypothetical protein